jgi:pyruvate formate-lyase activating enzyme-like uncharacterized protein
MTRARIILTWQCNRQCPYCCNDIPQIRDSFRPITLEALLTSRFDEYALTGGEPLLDPARTFRIARMLHHNRPNAILHLYTNADRLTDELIDGLDWSIFDGISVGIHDDDPEEAFLKNLYELDKRVPVRLKVPERLRGRDLILDNIVYWQLDDCLDMTPEPRFYLETPYDYPKYWQP